MKDSKPRKRRGRPPLVAVESSEEEFGQSKKEEFGHITNIITPQQYATRMSRPLFAPLHIIKQRKIVKQTCLRCNSSKVKSWRTGPEGPRTICHSCAVQFSKENNKLFPLFDSDTEIQSQSEDDELAQNISLTKANNLKRVNLKLEKILKQMKAADREIDRAFRKVISAAKDQTRTLPKSRSFLLNVEPFQEIGTETHKERELPYGENENIIHRTIIDRFRKEVKGQNDKIAFHLGRMHVPADFCAAIN
jgi:hypothetical protein